MPLRCPQAERTHTEDTKDRLEEPHIPMKNWYPAWSQNRLLDFRRQTKDTEACPEEPQSSETNVYPGESQNRLLELRMQAKQDTGVRLEESQKSIGHRCAMAFPSSRKCPGDMMPRNETDPELCPVALPNSKVKQCNTVTQLSRVCPGEMMKQIEKDPHHSPEVPHSAKATRYTMVPSFTLRCPRGSRTQRDAAISSLGVKLSLLTLLLAGVVTGSEFPDRECCDSVPPPPPNYHQATSTTTTTTPAPPPGLNTSIVTGNGEL